jgi:hypothetical protein
MSYTSCIAAAGSRAACRTGQSHQLPVRQLQPHQVICLRSQLALLLQPPRLSGFQSGHAGRGGHGSGSCTTVGITLPPWPCSQLTAKWSRWSRMML